MGIILGSRPIKVEFNSSSENHNGETGSLKEATVLHTGGAGAFMGIREVRS